jgi:hypothetical protein
MDRFSVTQAIQPNTNDGPSPACLQSRARRGHAALLDRFILNSGRMTAWSISRARVCREHPRDRVASFGPAAAAGWLADTRPDGSAIVALEAAGSLLFLVIFVPLGVSILAASAGMLGSDIFPRWLGVVGVFAGVAATVGGIIQVAALGSTGVLHDVGEPAANVGGVVFWLWLVATSIILWRHAPRRHQTGA